LAFGPLFLYLFPLIPSLYMMSLVSGKVVFPFFLCVVQGFHQPLGCVLPQHCKAPPKFSSFLIEGVPCSQEVAKNFSFPPSPRGSAPSSFPRVCGGKKASSKKVLPLLRCQYPAPSNFLQTSEISSPCTGSPKCFLPFPREAVAPSFFSCLFLDPSRR